MADQPQTEHKALLEFTIKDEAKGEVEAVIATLGVVDREGDVITRAAIPNGSRVKFSSYGHDTMYGATPVGHGVVAIEGDKAIVKGRLFLATSRGRETFEVLKEIGADQEWSFGFRILGSEVPTDEWREKGADRILTKLEPFEVSPVLIAAGKGTRTMAIKGDVQPPVPEPTPEPPAPAPDPAPSDPDEAAKAAELATKQAELAELQRVAAEELDRFQRTMRRFSP